MENNLNSTTEETSQAFGPSDEITKERSKTLKFAFKKSVPVLFGYIFLGTAFGILLQQAGYNFLWALLISLLVFAGSMQFVLVTFLSGGATLPLAAIMTFFINGRHVFYGLSFVETFKKMGKMYPYMVFSLTDETYSILCSYEVPKGIEHDKAMFLTALLNQSYWVIGSVMGALIGQIMPFDFTGIEFSMTALFVVIFIEQWKSFKSHIPAVVGLISATFFLLLLGPERFLLPSLFATSVVIMSLRDTIYVKSVKGRYDNDSE